MLRDSLAATTGASTTMPSFLVIGAAKAGTTSLWRQLDQHPEIFMHPKKQLNFFALEGEDLDFRGKGPRDSTLHSISTIEAYREQFTGVGTETAVGEASNLYLYNPRAAARIRHYLPGVKLIAILRHPADRAYSRFLHLVREGREPIPDFARALEEEEARVRDHWYPDFHYLRMGLYHEQLERYFGLFPKEQIKIYLQKDLRSDPLGTLRDVFGFLEVDETFVPDTTVKYNVSGVPKSKALHLFLQEARKAKPFVERLLSEKQRKRVLRVASGMHNRNLIKPRLSPEVRARLIEGYREDTLKLQDLIQRDLSDWLK